MNYQNPSPCKLKDKFIIKHCEKNYSDEVDSIIRNMINYYSLRNKDKKSKSEEVYQENIYECVISILKSLSKSLSSELGCNENDLFERLKDIHIKT